MAITYEGNTATFESVIYEDEVVPFREFLQENAGNEVRFDFRQCEDIHLAVMQLIMAYKKSYSCTYEFGDTKRLFETFLKGFSTSENHCN